MDVILCGNVIHVVFENICGNSEIRINPLAFIILKSPNLSSDKVTVKKCKKKNKRRISQCSWETFSGSSNRSRLWG